MKVLILDEWIPWPLDSGKKIRTYNLVARLAQKYNILYIAYASFPHDEDKVSKLESLGIKIFPVADKRTKKWTIKYYIDVFLGLFKKEPFSTSYHIRKEFAGIIMQVVKEENPDIIHCEWTNLAPFLGYVRGKPCVISSHNVESDIWWRLAKHGSNIIKRYVGYNQAKKMERFEKYWYSNVSRVISVSKEDMVRIQSYGANVDLVENGVDVNYYDEYFSGNDNNRDIIIFTASFDTFSNQDGAEYFINKIYPIIKNKRPMVQLYLVGKNPPERLKKYSVLDNSIYITGTVDDVRPYIANSLVSVVPLRIGGDLD